MNCHACKAAIPDASKFCPECGASAEPTAPCTHCGTANPQASTYCSGCGKSLSQTTSAAQRGSEDAEFAYLLSEERMLKVSNSNVRLPYGCLAVTMVDGVVNNVQDQIAIVNDGPSIFGQFLRSVSDLARGLMGKKEHEVKTYIVTNCRQLPLISYVQPVTTRNGGQGNLRFEFWIDASSKPSAEEKTALGLFFQRVMDRKPNLLFSEFRDKAISRVREILASYSGAELDSEEGRAVVMELLYKSLGISGKCTFMRGRKLVRSYVEIEKLQAPMDCPSCSTSFTQRVRFCEVCGENMENVDWSGQSKLLQTSGGEAVVLRLSYLVDATDGAARHAESDVMRTAFESILPVLRKFDTASLSNPATLVSLGKVASQALLQTYGAELSDVAVTDIRTAEQEWLFKTEALIAEELRSIEADRRGLAVDEASIDYQEAAFAITMRATLQQDGQEFQLRRHALDARARTAVLDIEEHELETRTALKREEISHEADGERFEREKEKTRRERELRREDKREDRTDELEQAAHDMRLDKDLARHDIDLADLTGDAQSRSHRREISDKSFEAEEALRLRASEMEQLGTIGEDLKDRQHHREETIQDRKSQREIDKLKAMADMEAAMAKQDQDFELSKAEKMKDLDAAQILAMQAAQLAKVAGEAGAVDIVKSIAQSQSDTAGVAIKDQMYAQMLETKENAARMALEAQKTAMDSLIKSNETLSKTAGAASSSATEGFKEAARIAQTTNEKSMDSMAKVATAAAARKPGKEEGDGTQGASCKNTECDYVFEGKAKKFCPKCGAGQSVGNS
jgi:hypothetical protein